MDYRDYCFAEANRLRSINYGAPRDDRESPYCTMKPDDRPVLDKKITRVMLAQRGLWPCCGAPYPGVHRNGCRAHIADIRSPEQFLAQYANPDYSSITRDVSAPELKQLAPIV